jgi:hypothetical protein
LHEEGHKEPWIIAMDEPPTKGRVLDYGMRWGIEPMFSDCKSRGFDVTQTQLKHPDRIERLLLVLAIALYWAVSTGMAAPQNVTKSKKSRRKPDFLVQTRLALPSSCRLDRSEHPKTMGERKFCQL